MNLARPIAPLALWAVAAALAIYLVVQLFLPFAHTMAGAVGDIFAVLGLLAIGGVIYALLAIGLIWAMPRFGGRKQASRLVQPLLASVLIFALAITTFEAAAFSVRGSIAYDSFVAWASLVFFVLYVLLLAAAGALGYAVARWKGIDPRPISLSSLIGLAVFMVLTLPLVEFINSCMVGTAFVLPSTC